MRLGHLALSVAAVLSAAQLHGQTTLRGAAEKSGLLIGAAAATGETGHDPLDERGYAETLAQQFNMLEAENAMKWTATQPAREHYAFEAGDKLVAFALAHGMKVRGHNLCWDMYNPEWLTETAKHANPAEMGELLHRHIQAVVEHYKGKVFAWDVVNEALAENPAAGQPALKNSIWYNKPGIGVEGAGYIEQAFRWAHEADPNARLFYNDYNVEGRGPKFEALYVLVKGLLASGVPIHGVGLQMHIDATGKPQNAGIEENMRRITSLGLEVQITEMDVRLHVSASGVASSGELAAQAATYGRVLRACLANTRCTAFQVWGFTDKYSWIPGTYRGFGAALPFDAGYGSKPAVSAMLETLSTSAQPRVP